ncbi:hypothetical protein NW755_012810 [Fusarium falciforme]|uniref:Capsule polysaccharide biosynthesis protein n=1 Tax=Fusarium falciforme TaxID=195108 RepID=A0A9W8QWH3_9HYPO|nr:hypothetical protein NW755_012810 [Fusarium falciforme]
MLTPLIVIKFAVAASVPVTISGLAYVATSPELRQGIYHFLTSPGWPLRLCLVVFAALNWKNLPLAWTARVFYSFVCHDFIKRDELPPHALFGHIVTTTRNSPLDTDYNLHKSNSTYFPDLDVSRTRLVSYLLTPGIQVVTDNARTQVVRDRSGRVMGGGFSLVLGSVFCSYKREVGMLESYELWSRVLTWDRKWLYFVTHFVAKDKGKKGKASPGGIGTDRDWSQRIIATAVSKYVFKLGRFTIHPSIILEESRLLPERPGGGWRGGELEVGDVSEKVESLEGEEEPVEGWKRIELMRRKGMELAEHFAALDAGHSLFDGREDGVLGRFVLG